jgi:hypothetical protein
VEQRAKKSSTRIVNKRKKREISSLTQERENRKKKENTIYEM